MKKILFILLLFLPLSVFGQNYFVAAPPLGSDATGDGSPDAPWATLSHAASMVLTSGSVINLMTNITDNNRVSLRVGVSVTGIGTRTITTNYVATSTYDAFIYLYSSSLTNGNQSISYLTIDGNNWTATRGIYVGHRNNVDIHHCTIQYFKILGVHYHHQIGWTTPPVTYASGNDFYDNILISNSGDRDLGGDGSDLRLDGQVGMNVYNCTIYENIKPLGESGDSFNLSFMKGLKMHDCTFYRHDSEADQWNFYAEIFHLRGGVEIYNCDFIGCATLDFSNWCGDENHEPTSSIREEYDYTVSVHDNFFTTSTGQQINTASLGHRPYCIDVEKGTWEYVYIYNNYGLSYPEFLILCSSCDTEFSHIYVYNNIARNLGSPDNTYPKGIQISPEGVSDVTFDNIHIANNVISAGTGYHSTGIAWSAQGTLTNSSIKNNIIKGYTGYAVYFDIQAGRSFSLNNVDVTYNCFYSNGNNSVGINGSISQTDVDRTTGNIISNPLFISTTDFHLQASSPCVRTGTYISFNVYDYDGEGWLNPPSMGAYEIAGSGMPVVYTTFITNVTETTAQSGGQIDSDGGEVVTARGVCWSTSTGPTTADDKTEDGTGTGPFTSTVTGLTNGQTYYLRAYATNSIGTAYGIQLSFTTPIPTSSGVRFIMHNGVFVIHNGKFIKSE